jgi:hypothetical protein
MEDLLQELEKQAGLDREQAKKALETITLYIKGKLPEMMHPMIDNFLSGPPPTTELDILD